MSLLEYVEAPTCIRPCDSCWLSFFSSAIDPYGPLEHSTLGFSRKTALLLALTSANRVGEMTTLMFVTPGWLQWSDSPTEPHFCSLELKELV